MIVVVSHAEDPHATRVLDLLGRAGHETLLLDLADLPERATLTFDYGRNGARPAIDYRVEGRVVDLAHARSAWYRRPQHPTLTAVGANADAWSFVANEWQEATHGLWQLLEVPWMNPPAADDVAGRKALQLRVARALGLRTPRTLVTSDPDAARAFIEREGVGRTIFKTFSCTHQVWRETRLVREEELAKIDSVRLSPVIFQEYIPASADLRITIVGDRIFPAAIDARGTDYEVDFRMSLGQSRVEACTIPRDVEERLFAMMRRFGLIYGAIDVRRTPEGEHVFLEINTGGEFLFIEDRTGQPIAQAVADWLSAPPERERSGG
ncbi:MAG TPA: alpha-L-glutamate ligase [Thermoanaerobaculia bacterium]|nr:alpha-L-glutamate ligase [Thermoanaerobaculia bacterium]